MRWRVSGFLGDTKSSRSEAVSDFSSNGCPHLQSRYNPACRTWIFGLISRQSDDIQRSLDHHSPMLVQSYFKSLGFLSGTWYSSSIDLSLIWLSLFCEGGSSLSSNQPRRSKSGWKEGGGSWESPSNFSVRDSFNLQWQLSVSCFLFRWVKAWELPKRTMKKQIWSKNGMRLTWNLSNRFDLVAKKGGGKRWLQERLYCPLCASW